MKITLKLKKGGRDLKEKTLEGLARELMRGLENTPAPIKGVTHTSISEVFQCDSKTRVVTPSYEFNIEGNVDLTSVYSYLTSKKGYTIHNPRITQSPQASNKIGEAA